MAKSEETYSGIYDGEEVKTPRPPLGGGSEE